MATRDGNVQSFRAMQPDSDRKVDSERVVAELANRIGTLGVEVADISGHLEEVTGRVSEQAAQFKELQETAQTMVIGNHSIDQASRKAQGAASAAGRPGAASPSSPVRSRASRRRRERRLCASAASCRR